MTATHHCAILAVDVEGFGSPARSDELQARLRQRLHQFVDQALARADVAPGQVLLHRDLGDGLLILIDPNFPLGRLLGPGIGALASKLGSYNADATSPAARLRLRVALHHGMLLRDAYGYTGQALVHAFRLLDAEVVKAALARVRAGLVVVLSDAAHQRLRNGLARDPLTGCQPVWVAHKETTTRGWLHVPGEGVRPQLERLLDGNDHRPEPVGPGGMEERVRRRELLAFSGTLMGSATLDLLTGYRRVSLEDALVAQGVARRLHRLDESHSVLLVDAARSRHAAAVDRMARTAGEATVRANLLRALAHVAAVGGVMATVDLLDQRSASRRFRIALRAADQAGDPVLSGMVCLRMSEAALAARRISEALELALAGGELVGAADPALRATLWLAAANAHEAAGSASAALHALDAGEDLVGTSPLLPSAWTRVDAARFTGGRGMVEGALHRWRQAEAGLLTGLAAYPPGNGLRGVLLAHLARVRFARDDPEQAAALAMEALPIVVRLDSPRRLAAMEPLRPWLRRYAQVRVVANVSERLDEARRVVTRGREKVQGQEGT